MEKSIQHSLDYLASSEALSSLKANAYWPKWNSPWWHMTLLHEMGLAKQIPKQALHALVTQLKASPLTVFPIRPEDNPDQLNLSLSSHCHCSLGNIYQTLAASGIDVDGELPWMRRWFLRYQLPDGGLNCDEGAYLKNPSPSSIVGTISPLEAILLHTYRPFTAEEERFLDLGARCLLERQLIQATSNPHNSDEREDEEDWLKLCFPRFYLYDVLRGLSFVVRWADRRNQTISEDSIENAVSHLENRFPDQQVRIGRLSYEGISTLTQSASWDRKKKEPGSLFPLLEQVSQVGAVSPFLVRQWAETRSLIADLRQRKLLV
jgi:hypothetical protein